MKEENGHKSNKGRMRKKCGKIIIIAVVFTRCFRVEIFSLLTSGAGDRDLDLNTQDLFGSLRFYVGYSSVYLY
jgi:hypothetical protein